MTRLVGNMDPYLLQFMHTAPPDRKRYADNASGNIFNPTGRDVLCISVNFLVVFRVVGRLQGQFFLCRKTPGCFLCVKNNSNKKNSKEKRGWVLGEVLEFP